MGRALGPVQARRSRPGGLAVSSAIIVVLSAVVIVVVVVVTVGVVICVCAVALADNPFVASVAQLKGLWGGPSLGDGPGRAVSPSTPRFASCKPVANQLQTSSKPSCKRVS